MKGVTVITHPLVQHNLTRLRDHRTQPQEFRRCLSEVAALMVYEATRSFAVNECSVKTPLATTRGSRLQREVVLVPILRAGLGMLDSILQLIPHARVGFSARGMLKRSDFGVSFGVPTAENHYFGVGDDVEVQLETEFSGPALQLAAR